MPTALLLRKHASRRLYASTEILAFVSSATGTADTACCEQQPLIKCQPTKQSIQAQKARVVIQLILFFCIFLAGLLLLSEMQLRHYPEHFTSSIFSRSDNITQTAAMPLGASEPMHWTRHVYGYMLKVKR